MQQENTTITVLLFKNCFGYSFTLFYLYKIWNQFVIFHKKVSCNVDQYYIEHIDKIFTYSKKYIEKKLFIYNDKILQGTQDVSKEAR